tara:strand:+ start:592 stop:1008 length:417 start_codon:yes stop_codon:yes gene_type:complete
MGLDWIVQTYKKNTFTSTKECVSLEEDEEENEYVGVSYYRGKNVAHLLSEYGDNDLANDCYGEETPLDADEDGEICTKNFINVEKLTEIYKTLGSYKLKEIEDWTMKDQKDEIEELDAFINDLKEYDGKWDLKVICWF